MVDILHRVGMKSASVAEVYEALTTVEGLSGWWATDTKPGSTDDRLPSGWLSAP
jgi:uncharacterized protein YndB with AHSA1/START domain